MRTAEVTDDTVSETAVDQAPSPLARDWFWRPLHAKLMWALATIYWIGLYVLLLVPDDRQDYYAASAMILLVFLFNPITVLALLGRGFLRAKVACGDWIAVPGAPRKSLVDPYTDSFDVRSGDLHLRHIGVIND